MKTLIIFFSKNRSSLAACYSLFDFPKYIRLSPNVYDYLPLGHSHVMVNAKCTTFHPYLVERFHLSTSFFTESPVILIICHPETIIFTENLIIFVTKIPVLLLN